jgi:hypothetical protein
VREYLSRLDDSRNPLRIQATTGRTPAHGEDPIDDRKRQAQEQREERRNCEYANEQP